MEKITNINDGAIDDNFCVSDMLGSFKLSEFNGKNVFYQDEAGVTHEDEAVKFFITNANTSLSDDVIEKIARAPKYVISGLGTFTDHPSLKNISSIASGKTELKDERSQTIKDADTYTASKEMGRYYETYEKTNPDIYNGGVYFLASVIDGKVHIMSLNVSETGQTGKSVTLSYLPKGKAKDAVMIERLCLHGTLGNKHINPNGSIIENTDLHIHRNSEEYIDSIISDPNLSEHDKVVALNSPPAELIRKNVYENDLSLTEMTQILNKDYGLNYCGILDQIITDTDMPVTDAIIKECKIAEKFNPTNDNPA